MKFAFVHKSYGRVGGTEGVMANLARGFRSRGHVVDLYVAESRDPSVRFIRLLGRRASGLPSLALLLSSWVRLRGRASSYDQVVHFGRTGPRGLYRAGGGCYRALDDLQQLRPRRLGARLLRRLSVARWLRLWHERRAVQSKDCLIVVPSERARQDLIRCYGPAAQKVRVLHNGVDTERFLPARRWAERSQARAAFGIPDDAQCLLFLGSDPWRKGLDVVFDALSRLDCEQSVYLLVLGCRRWPSWVRRRVAQHGIEGRVTLGGEVADPMDAYAAADLLVLPTRQDPFANVTLEALASGLSVVTSPENGAVERVGECAAVSVLDSHEPDSLARVLSSQLRKMRDEEDRRTLELAARSTAESCGMSSVVGRWEALLCEGMEAESGGLEGHG